MKPFLAMLLLTAAGSLVAGEVRDIELRRLFEPTPAELQMERAGRIHIYEDLWDVDIDRAMDEEYGRIESMMFIRVKITDDEGEVQRNPDTGTAMVQDDGC